MVVAQSVRASVCGAEGRGFEPHHPPVEKGFHCEGLFLLGSLNFGAKSQDPRLKIQDVRRKTWDLIIQIKKRENPVSWVYVKLDIDSWVLKLSNES